MIKGNAFQSSKGACPRGHLYDAANTKLTKSTRPGFFKRQCRKCNAEAFARSNIRDRLVKLAMRCDDPAAPFPDGFSGATAAILAEAFGEQPATVTAATVLQAIQCIRDRECQERRARKERNRAARIARDRERDRARDRSRARAALDPEREQRRIAHKLARQAARAALDAAGDEPATLADVDLALDLAPLDLALDLAGYEAALDLAHVEQHQVRESASNIRATDVDQVHEVEGDQVPADQVDQVEAVTEAPAIVARAPIAFAPRAAPPRRPRRFERQARRFLEWREQLEFRQRYGADDRVHAGAW